MKGHTELACEDMHDALLILMPEPDLQLIWAPIDLLVEFASQRDECSLARLKMAAEQPPATWSDDPGVLIAQLQQPQAFLLKHCNSDFNGHCRAVDTELHLLGVLVAGKEEQMNSCPTAFIKDCSLCKLTALCVDCQVRLAMGSQPIQTELHDNHLVYANDK